MSYSLTDEETEARRLQYNRTVSHEQGWMLGPAGHTSHLALCSGQGLPADLGVT